MKKKVLVSLFSVLLFVGCNNIPQPNTPVVLYTPSKLSVIKKGAKIYIQGLHNYKYNAKDLIVRIRNSFKDDKIFTVVNNIKKADVIISINTFYSYRADNSTDTKYNKEYSVKRKVFRDGRGRETGGQDYLVTNNFSSSTATVITTVSIYDKTHLEPLAYFDISPVDTDRVYLGKSGTIYSSSAEFNAKLTDNIVKKMNDLLTTKNKKVNVFLPNNANKELTSLLLSTQYDELFKKAKMILPDFSIEEVSIEKYKDIEKEASKKGSKIKERDLEKDLANFYIYYMAKEAVDVSKKNLKEVFNAYKKIISLTKDDSLILACANSLGRVEFKAERLNINLGKK